MESTHQRRVQSMREGIVKHASPKRVLIVEDDPDAREVLRAWAESQGCQVRTACSANQALECSVTFVPELVVADYLLEGELTGVDLIAQLRARGGKARCVLVTGLLHKALLESLTRIHGVPILAKPFDLSRLTELLSKTRSLSRGSREPSGRPGASSAS
jgi:DNA-binding NtrC family response regulator